MRTLACLLLLLALGVLAAAEPAPAPAPLFTDQEWSSAQRSSQPAATTGAGSMAILLVGLVVVVGLAVGLGWLVKRVNRKRLRGSQGRNLELLETVAVGPRRHLALVRCGSHWLVVGVGERELIAVATLPAPVEAAPAPAPSPVPAAAVAPAPSPFASELTRLLGGSKP